MAIDPSAHSSLHQHSSHSICIRKVQFKENISATICKSSVEFQACQTPSYQKSTDIFDLESPLNNVNATE